VQDSFIHILLQTELLWVSFLSLFCGLLLEVSFRRYTSLLTHEIPVQYSFTHTHSNGTFTTHCATVGGGVGLFYKSLV